MSDGGGHFAYRERAFTPGEPVRPVEVVRKDPPKSNKVKIRWLDGEYEGLEHRTHPRATLLPSRSRQTTGDRAPSRRT